MSAAFACANLRRAWLAFLAFSLLTAFFFLIRARVLGERFFRPRDLALVWAEEGLEAVRKVAKKSPESFVAIAARICPNDVRLTLEQAIPGGMSLEDYSLMREVIAAIRESLPDADQSLMDVFRR
jgi:hypothetical protein